MVSAIKTLTIQEIENLTYRIDQAIANNAIEGIVTPPEDRNLLIKLHIEKAKGILTHEEVRDILVKHVLDKHK